MIDRVIIQNFRKIEECHLILKEGITVISGKNGSGKSSIVEAITFCLYGQSKSGTKKDSVRRRNASDAHPTIVAVDFTCGFSHYRCLRWLTKKGSIMARLDAYDDKAYNGLPLEGDIMPSKAFPGTSIATSASGTTSAVETILNVSYDGFKASFIAQQKELDSLANMTPEKSKRFFLDLLGYSKLDAAKQKASSELAASQKVLSVLERQSIDEKEIEKEIKSISKGINSLEKRIGKGTRMLAESKRLQSSLSQESNELTRTVTMIESYSKDSIALKKEQSSLESQIKDLKAKIKANEELSRDYDPSSSLQEKLISLEAKATRHRELQGLKSQAREARDTIKIKSSKESELEKKIKALSDRVSSKPDLGPIQMKIGDYKAQAKTIDSQTTQYESQLQDIQSLLSEVEKGDAISCPTCGSDMSGENGIKHLSSEEARLRRAIDETQCKRSDIQERISGLQNELEDAKMALRLYDKNASDKEKAERDLLLTKRDKESAASTLESIERTLSERHEDNLSGKQLARIEEDILSLREKASQESKMKDAYISLTEQRSSWFLKNDRLDQVLKELQEKGSYLKANAKAQERFQEVNKALGETNERASQYQRLLTKYEKEKAGLESQLANGREKLRQAKGQSQELEKRKEEHEILQDVKLVIDELRQELPSRIAPKLSDYASSLLEIATDGKYPFMTMDESYSITVYSDLGDSIPLAMLSGGESDIVSLCVRIAISRMILESSGLSSQTMILDEIFGALDDERRASATNAIRRMRHEIPRVLCITHIDEIKEMADHSYIVEEDENGVSHVREAKDNNPREPLESN